MVCRKRDSSTDFKAAFGSRREEASFRPPETLGFPLILKAAGGQRKRGRYAFVLEITTYVSERNSGFQGNPTVEAEVTLENSVTGRAAVSGASTSDKFEAVELRDGETRYFGLGGKRVKNEYKAGKLWFGKNASASLEIDRHPHGCRWYRDNKGNLGANATLKFSMAVAKAAAKTFFELPLYQYLGGIHARQLPVPMMNISMEASMQTIIRWICRNS